MGTVNAMQLNTFKNTPNLRTYTVFHKTQKANIRNILFFDKKLFFPKRNLVLGDTTKNIFEVSSDRWAEPKLGPNPDVKSWGAHVFFQLERPLKCAHARQPAWSPGDLCNRDQSTHAPESADPRSRTTELPGMTPDTSPLGHSVLNSEGQ